MKLHYCQAKPNELPNIWQQSLQKQDSVYVLELNNDLTLHLKKFSQHTYSNGGEVLVFKTVNYEASEFILARRLGKYYAVFHKNGFENHLFQDLHGNLVWMEELWDQPFCSTTEKGFAFQNDTSSTGNMQLRQSDDDSLNILFVYNESALQRMDQQMNIAGEEAAYMWSNVALTFLNFTLQNSGIPFRCRISTIEYVSFNANNVNNALGAFSSFSGPFAYLRELAVEECTHIRSFVMDYPGQGPSGIGNIFGRNATQLSSVSIVSYGTFCHEIGHNLGFGHGPQANDQAGFTNAARGFNTLVAGWSGRSLSTLMDYGNRVFQFSNQTEPYEGEFEEHHGKILGAPDRNNAEAAILAKPLIQLLSSARTYIDTSICEGMSVFGYQQAGMYRDTLEDTKSCTGLNYRTLKLSIVPAFESNYAEIRNEYFFSQETTFQGQHIYAQKIFGGKLWAFSQNHIYLFDSTEKVFERFISFPDPDNGPIEDSEGMVELLIDINYIDGTLYAKSNKALYFLDLNASQWIPYDGSNLPLASGPDYFRIEGSTILKSTDHGITWQDCNIPFESGPQGIVLHNIRIIDDFWFVQQFAPYHLYISKDKGSTWRRASTNFLPNINRLLILKDTMRIKAINNFQWYYSSDEGLSWSQDTLWQGQIEIILADTETEMLIAQNNNLEVYAYKEGDIEPYFVSKIEGRIAALYDKYWASHHEGIYLHSYEGLKPLDLNLTLCEGDSAYGFNQSGKYIVQTSHNEECDSIFRLQLDIIETDSISLDTVICHDQNYLGYDMSGLYTALIPDSSGCLHALTLNLEVLDSIQLESIVTQPINESKGSIQISSITGGMPPYNLIWSGGQDGYDLEDLDPGTYLLTVEDSLGCTEEYSFDLNLTNSIANILSENIKPFPNPVKAGNYFQISGLDKYEYRWEIADLYGRVISTSETQSDQRVPQLPGMYSLRLHSEGKLASFLLSVIP